MGGPMHKTLLSVIALTLLLQIAAARPQNPREQEHKSLDIYYIDTEGGKAVLFVSPAGETLLYDTGTGGDGNRDLNRILAVIKAANLPVEQLDHVIVSHYHGDHAGNVAALADKLPIRNYYDHGGWTVELQAARATAFNAYREIREKAHVTDFTGPPVLVHAARPRIAVMNNSPSKGGTPDTFRIVKTSPGLLDYWQL